MDNTQYRIDIDSLKGIAIIAVVLFHIGILKSGYLGVDLFFVINGFLVIPPVVRKIQSGEFGYFAFLGKRLNRLLPLIVIASAVSLILGYFLMLPDHYENLAESVIASNCMSENILSAITTKNYWDVVNEYKPLMHLWYVGILFEFYLIFPLLLIIANRTAKFFRRNQFEWMKYALLVCVLLSLIMYLLPNVTAGNRFYLIPFRFFEIGIGGVIALNISNLNWGGQNLVTLFLILILCSSVLCGLTGAEMHTNPVIGQERSESKIMPFSSSFALLCVVALSSLAVIPPIKCGTLLKSSILQWLGKASYSIFIWHQVLLAFYRYSVSDKLSGWFVVLFIAVVLLVSAISYYTIELKISSTRKTTYLCTLAAVIVMLPSVWIFRHAGVVRDVPELDLRYSDNNKLFSSEYADRVYRYNEDFLDDKDKINVLVVGISFARDFANVLLESEFRDSINLSYAYKWTDSGLESRVCDADIIFSFSSKTAIPGFVWKNVKTSTRVYGIGTKNYGACNGLIYAKRNSDSYFTLTTEMENGYEELNEQWKNEWGDFYVDMIEPVLQPDGTVRVFTEDNKFISQDCRHLTRAGAQWYSRVLDLQSIFDTRL